MKPLVSVVVTCYNHEAYIAQCLDSIFKQTHREIELFIYNDGSRDASEAVIAETVKNSPFALTQVITQENKGVVYTRNQAFDVITGDFLLFVDSDNYLESNYIEAMLTTMEEEKADIVYTSLVDPETACVVHQVYPFNLEQFYIENQIDNCSLLRVSCIGKARYDMALNYKNLEDYDFMWQLIVAQGARPVPCNKTHLNYRVLPHSVSARDNLKSYFENYAYILGKYFTAEPQLGQEALIENMRRLHDLKDVMHPYLNQTTTLYFNFGNGFSEDDVECIAFNVKDDVVITIPKDCIELRIDVSERPVYLECFSVIVRETGNVLSPVYTNGIQIGQGYCFTEPDPIVIYQVSHLQGQDIQLSYQLYQLNQLMLPEFGLRKVTLTLDEERQQLLKENRNLQEAYASLINSRRWKISTAIIRLFRRTK